MLKISNIQTPVFLVVFLFIFVSVFLFTYHKGKIISNRLLGGLFLCYGLWILDIYFYFTLYDRLPYLSNIFNSLIWLFGPGLLFYVNSVIYSDFRFRKKHLLHLLPFFTIVIIYVFVFHIRSIEYKKHFMESARMHIGPIKWGGDMIILIYYLAYIIAAFKVLNRYTSIQTNKLSNYSRINTLWLKWLIWGFFIIYLNNLFVVAFQYLILKESFLLQNLYYLLPILLVFITAILFKSLKHPEIFSGIHSEEVNILKQQKYLFSSLSKEELDTHADKLENIMKSLKPYLDPDLVIQDLADHLNLSVKTVSQVINDRLGMRFFDYVNKYRIEDAKNILINKDDPKITVTEILYKVGFNSKSSFNTAFKKFTGKTPTEFKRMN